MIVDTSAVIAIARDEPERDRFIEALEAAWPAQMSTATWLESAIVGDRRADPILARRFDDLIDSFGVRLVEVTPEQVQVARQAYRDFGRGSGHPARLNFGDCFSYALAHVTREPLLFKGDDFIHTDVRPAVL